MNNRHQRSHFCANEKCGLHSYPGERGIPLRVPYEVFMPIPSPRPEPSATKSFDTT